jgi:HPt (histidine-containing phosphotransfer) domain-containing protein
MNGVLGMLELLQETPLNAEQRELAEIVRESSLSLLKIIDDILDFSKIEAGKLEIERAPMSPLALVEGVADALAPNAHKKKLQLTTFVDASVPPMVEGDPVRLRQILFNLIGNAIKFTERGEIAVSLSLDASGPEGMILRALVRDTGIGASAITMLRRYIESTAALLAEIDRAIAVRCADDVGNAAHSAKGASLSAGADELAALLADLETATKAKAWDAAQAMHALVEPAFRRVREAVMRLDA